MQAALRHAEHSATLPWQALPPDEEMMSREDPQDDAPRRAWLFGDVLDFLFADEDPRRWQNVAMRAVALFRTCLPAELVGRKEDEVRLIEQQSGAMRKFEVRQWIELISDEDSHASMTGIVRFIFPDSGRRWLSKGTMRAYLLARAYRPKLVEVQKLSDGCRERSAELSYEDLEEIFSGARLTTEEDRDRARSRWSARAQAAIRRPIEEAGGTARLPFGKSAQARDKMRKSAEGNHNRRKLGKESANAQGHATGPQDSEPN